MGKIALLPLLVKTAICAGAASHGLPPFIGGTLKAIIENLLGALAGQVLSQVTGLGRRTSADAPGEALQLALARALAAACEEIDIEKWVRDRTHSLLDLKPPYHAHVEDFLRELQRNPEDIVGSDLDDGMLRKFLDSPSLANFSPLAAVFGEESLPGLAPDLRTELVEALFLRVRIRFWDEVKSDDVAWRAYSAEVFKEIRQRIESLGAGQEKILAALAGRELQVRELPSIPAEVASAIGDSQRNLQIALNLVNGKLDRLLASGVRIETTTKDTHRLLKRLGIAIFVLAVVGGIGARQLLENAQRREAEAQKQAELARKETAELNRFIRESYYAQATAGGGPGRKDLSPAERRNEYERLVAEAEGISVEEVHQRFEAGTRSRDALVSSQAHLLAGEPELALEKAALVEEEEADAFERIAEARWVEARSRYDLGQLEESLKKYRELLALLDESSEIRVSIHQEAGTVLFEMGRFRESIAEYRSAEAIQRKELPPHSVPLAETLVWLGDALLSAGDLQAAEESLREALPTIRAMYSTVDSMADMNLRLLGICLVLRGKPAEAVEIFRENLALVKADPANRLDVEAFVSAELAWALQLDGKGEEAGRYLAKAIQIERQGGEGADADNSYLGYDDYYYDDYSYDYGSSAAVDWLSQWADFLRDGGYFKEEEALRRNLIRIAGAGLDPDRYFMAGLESRMGFCLQSQLKLEEAESWFRKALGRYQESFEPRQWELARAQEDLGVVLRDLGKLDEAEPLLRQAVKLFEAHAKIDDPDLAGSLGNLAFLLECKRAFEEAETLSWRALKILENAWGKGSPRLLVAMGNLIPVLSANGKVEQARELCDRGLEIHRRKPGDDPRAAAILYSLRGNLLLDIGEPGAAEEDLRKCVDMSRELFGLRDSRVARNLGDLARCLYDKGEMTEAERVNRQALEIASSALGTNDPSLVIYHNALGMALHGQDKLEEAEQAYGQALEIAEKKWGKEAKSYSHVLFNLSSVLIKRRRLEDAERFLERAMAGAPNWPPDHIQRAFALNCEALLREAQGRLSEAESLSREHLKIFFQYRKRMARPHRNEDKAVAIHSSLMTKQGRSKEEVEAEILKVRQEAGI